MKPDRILIEASGVAEPAAIAAAFDHGSVRSKLRLSRIITLVDASVWPRRETFGSFFHSQIQQADLVALNKVDLLKPAEFDRTLDDLRAEFPDRPIMPVSQGRIKAELVWSGSSAAPAREEHHTIILRRRGSDSTPSASNQSDHLPRTAWSASSTTCRPRSFGPRGWSGLGAVAATWIMSPAG